MMASPRCRRTFENFESLFVPNALLKGCHSSLPASLTSSLERSPSPPPNRPQGACLARSNSAEQVISSASTLITRVIPRPPRVEPAPAPSAFSLYSACSQGKRVSNTSTGVFWQFPLGTQTALLPSLSARPPQPIPSKL